MKTLIPRFAIWRLVFITAVGAVVAGGCSRNSASEDIPRGAPEMHWEGEIGGFNRIWTGDGLRLCAIATSGKIFTSDDSGTTWTLRSSGDDQPDLGALFGSEKGNKVLAGGSDAAVLLSSDGGAHWAHTKIETLGDSAITALWISPDGRNIRAASEKGLIVFSDTSGSKWTTQVRVRPDIRINSLWASTDGKKVWAVGNSGVIVFSSDAGRTWIQQRTASPKTSRSIRYGETRRVDG